MCGISGFFSIAPQDATYISKMTDCIRHRGPDDEGYVLFQDLTASPAIFAGKDSPGGSCCVSGIAYSPEDQLGDSLGRNPVTFAMGHRRLSIVDLSPFGHQPMCTPDRRYWIVYNGEIYNHAEIRMELEKIGHIFLSHSDTEVILAAYREWGDDCLSRFNGMFAFLMYDSEKKLLFAARDRFGIKPLYYRIGKDGFYFASEIKQFTVLSDWQAKMNGQRAYDFLNWGITDHTDETLFQGVFQLCGGQKLLLDLNAISTGEVKYDVGERFPVTDWYFLQPKPFIGGAKEAIFQFRNRLFEAVKSHLRADVSVGSCLSGGLDSSSIVCITNQLLREEGVEDLQKTFSACAEVPSVDERKWVEIVVKATGVDGYYVYPSLRELFHELPKITWHQDEPFGSTSIYAQWSVFQLAARNNIKVILDGQGADEQLAGYHGYFGPHLASLLRSFNWLKLVKEILAIHRVHGYSYLNIFARFANATMPEFLRDRLRGMFGKAVIYPSWLNAEKLDCVCRNPMLGAGASDAKSIKDLSLAQLTASNLQMLLHWEDRDSMGHSIESRVPFLDHRLVEFSLGLPDELKLFEGITKRVLRDSMVGILPDQIRGRIDKIGFATPEKAWLREDESGLFRKYIESAIRSTDGVIREAEALKLVDEMISGKTAFNFFPWRLISFAEWVRQFKVSTR
jgi:asparagine synthase (glutamine-hydrolysing)